MDLPVAVEMRVVPDLPLAVVVVAVVVDDGGGEADELMWRNVVVVERDDDGDDDECGTDRDHWMMYVLINVRDYLPFSKVLMMMTKVVPIVDVIEAMDLMLQQNVQVDLHFVEDDDDDVFPMVLITMLRDLDDWPHLSTLVM